MRSWVIETSSTVSTSDYFEGIILDITERMRSESALIESEKRLKDLVENAAIGIYQVTDKGKFEMVNPMFAHIFGYSSPEDFLTNVKDIYELYLHPEDTGAR